MTTSEATDVPSSAAGDPFGPVRSAIQARGRELAAYPGVVSVRPGYRFVDGRLTPEPVVRVAVLRKQGAHGLAPGALLPRSVGGVPVDVVPAGPEEQLAAALRMRPRGEAAAAAVRAVAAGEGTVDLRTPLEAESAAPPSAAPAVLAQAFPEPARPPVPVDEEMTLVLHAGPDAGWRLLHRFLQGTRERLTATMFEFTARHVLDALLRALPAPRTLAFVMDHETEPHGLDNPQVRQELADALGERLEFAWAPVSSDNVTTVGYFPTSYHIKVVVRDGTAVWLSSGNFKPSSQPEEDPFSPPAGFDAHAFQRRKNREWHVIAECEALARQFEFFIRHDLAESAKVQASAPAAAAPLPDLLVPEAPTPAPAEAALAPPRFFPELVLRKKLRVQPLLTPRHFAEQVLPLLRGAKRRVWFQNQSLKPDLGRPAYMELFNALGRLSRDPDIDTRIIARGDFNPHRILEALQEAEYDMRRVRLQKGCHTKGLIIDDDAVVVGSHNWTGQGTTDNRDASLIIHDPEAVAYYARIFEHDWDTLATGRVDADEVVALLAEGDAVPAGMRRVSWSEMTG